jgi:CheY-like chemotaxis protein
LVRLPRPIDAMHVLRELDLALLTAAQRDAAAAERDNPRTEPAGFAPPSQLSELAALFPDRIEASSSQAPKADSAFDALLVDDSEVALRFLELKLADLGLRTRSVTDSDAALAQLARHRVDWVFLDVELGTSSRLDGLALCRRIKAMTAHGAAPRVAMVSAHASATDRVRGSLARLIGHFRAVV